MTYPAASCEVSIGLYDIFSQSCHPRMFLPEVQPASRLDSRQKSCGNDRLRVSHYATRCGELPNEIESPYNLPFTPNAFPLLPRLFDKLAHEIDDLGRRRQHFIPELFAILPNIETRLEAHDFLCLSDEFFVLGQRSKSLSHGERLPPCGELGGNKATRLRFWLAIFAAFSTSYLIPVGALP